MGKRCVLSHLILISLLVNSYLGMLTLPDSFKETNAIKEFGSLKIIKAYNNDERYKRDVPDSFPDHISCALNFSGETLGLDLHRNRNIDAKKPVYVMRDGKIVFEPISPLKDVEYFQDTESGAALAVICETKPDGTCDYRVEGMVTKGEHTFLVYPSEEHQQQRPGAPHPVDGDSPYVVEKLNSTAMNISDHIFSDTIPRQLPERFGRFRRQTQKVTYNVELMMITDSSVYKFWRDRTSASTPTERRAMTLSKIKQYYAFILNAIDLRYKNIKEADLAMNILYSGLLIIEDATISTWTDGIAKTNPLNPNLKIVDSRLAYDSFTSWVQGRTDLPKSDHVMLFTAYDLSSNGDTSNTGITFTGSICGNRSTSICENRFGFVSGTTFAQILGHNLGASDDGDDNACAATDHYIMAPTVGLAKGATARNAWYFSSCSVESFRQTIQQLSSNNCLLSESSSLDRDALTPLLQALPGQVYSADTQCAYQLGEGSTFCRSVYNQTSYEDVCSDMYCSIPGTTKCRSVFPARGTSCGQNKWCDYGECVFDTQAPAVAESCPLGEYPGIISGLNQTCAQMIHSRGDLCYREHFNQLCCESCQLIRSNNPSCEFGDKNPDCSKITAQQCYKQRVEDICCETCAKFQRTNQTACQYGDKSTSCSGILPSQCYIPSNEALCCEACAKFRRTGRPGCQFGDKTTQCSGIVSTQCYNSHNEDLCCETCAKFKRQGRRGCEYGDRLTGCKITHCSSPAHLIDCCGTCNTPTTG